MPPFLTGVNAAFVWPHITTAPSGQQSARLASLASGLRLAILIARWACVRSMPSSREAARTPDSGRPKPLSPWLGPFGATCAESLSVMRIHSAMCSAFNPFLPWLTLRLPKPHARPVVQELDIGAFKSGADFLTGVIPATKRAFERNLAVHAKIERGIRPLSAGSRMCTNSEPTGN
jgi:hypothetical protein